MTELEEFEREICDKCLQCLGTGIYYWQRIDLGGARVRTEWWCPRCGGAGTKRDAVRCASGLLVSEHPAPYLREHMEHAGE